MVVPIALGALFTSIRMTGMTKFLSGAMKSETQIGKLIGNFQTFGSENEKAEKRQQAFNQIFKQGIQFVKKFAIGIMAAAVAVVAFGLAIFRMTTIGKFLEQGLLGIFNVFNPLNIIFGLFGGTLQSLTNEIRDGLKPVMEGFVSWLQENGPKIFDTIRVAFDAFMGFVNSINWEPFKVALTKVVDIAVGFMEKVAIPFVEKVGPLFSKAINILTTEIKVGGKKTAIWKLLLQGLIILLSPLIVLFFIIAGSIAGLVVVMGFLALSTAAMTGALFVAMGVVGRFFESFGPSIMSGFGWFVKKMGELWQLLWKVGGAAVQGAMAIGKLFVGAIQDAIAWVGDVLRLFWDLNLAIMAPISGGIIDVLSNLPGQLTPVVDLFERLYSVLTDPVEESEGLAAWLIDWAKGQ